MCMGKGLQNKKQNWRGGGGEGMQNKKQKGRDGGGQDSVINSKQDLWSFDEEGRPNFLHPCRKD